MLAACPGYLTSVLILFFLVEMLNDIHIDNSQIIALKCMYTGQYKGRDEINSARTIMYVVSNGLKTDSELPMWVCWQCRLNPIIAANPEAPTDLHPLHHLR